MAEMEVYTGTTMAYVDDKSQLVIVNDKVYEDPKASGYISATEFADANGKGRAMAKRLCAEGRIEGAYKTSSCWLIPANATWPKRKPRMTKKEKMEQVDRKSGQ